ncbi:MAG: hypothetical protein P4L92_00125 [Rudaea sp.]|nr:hypothetical protein [Rudaea sp.]
MTPRPVRSQAHIFATETASRIPKGAIACVLQENLIVDPTDLGHYCSGTLNERADDAIVFAGVVAFADRAVPRTPARSWAREIRITIPVLDLDFWQDSTVDQQLRSLLNLVTGDVWELAFIQRHQRLTAFQQNSLLFRANEEPVVMPFSDGMDSLAVARLFHDSEPNAPLIMVTTGKRPDADAQARRGESGGRRFRFSVPFKIRSPRLRELSYRSRALIYGTMTAVAAQLSGAKRIIVGESGQGALGPWLTPVGQEAPDIRMHPIYTSKLAEVMRSVLNIGVRFEHPRLWTTKGQTLADLKERGLESGWENTRSCARDARDDMVVDGGLAQCGVCAACLLRRVSVHEAGLSEPASSYLWWDLQAPTLEQAQHEDSRATKMNDMNQAACGVLALDQLAELDRSSSVDLSFKAWELAQVLPDEQGVAGIEKKLRRLIGDHAKAWSRFVDAQGDRSFLKQWIGVPV